MENRHYILCDDRGRITDGWSDGPCPGRDVRGAVVLAEGAGYQFRLFPEGEENPALRDEGGVCLYHWDGAKVCLRTEEELQADREAMPREVQPTQQERLAALEAAMLTLLQGGGQYV